MRSLGDPPSNLLSTAVLPCVVPWGLLSEGFGPLAFKRKGK